MARRIEQSPIVGWTGVDFGYKPAITFARVLRDEAPVNNFVPPVLFCCLYPWPDPLGIPFYPPEDLPDTVVVNEGSQEDGIYIHDAGTYDFYFSPEEGFYYKISANDSSVPTNPPFWMLFEYSEFLGHWVLQSLPVNWACLIDPDSYTPRFDEFPDSLTINGSDTVTRDPLINPCEWLGDDWILRYNPTTYRFTLNGTVKTDPQSSPVGTYGANTVS